MLPVKRLFLSSMLTGLFVFQSFGVEVGLRGKVIDEFGVPVADAKVSLRQLDYSTTTNSDGEFVLDQSSIAVINGLSDKKAATVGMTPKFLELGNYYDATITVFSIRGAVISKMTVKNQNHVAINKLIPQTVNSQAVVISVAASDRIINLRAVKCGSQWVYNNREIVKTSMKSVSKRAAAEIVDTLQVKKSGMQKQRIPLSSLVATLDDIIMKYDVSDGTDTTRMIGSIEISAPSQTFKTPLSVTLSTKIEGAVIRYTKDGTLPTESSEEYSSAITIDTTVQLRAAAFVDGTLSGYPSTAIYILRNFDYTSDIPIMIMEGYGKGLPTDKYNFIDLGFMTFEPQNGGKSSIADIPTIATRAGYHLRGQSSMMFFKQAPYRIELWDNWNHDAKYPALGMPTDADWALISPCTDNTLIRNTVGTELGKQIGLRTVQYRFVEVFIHPDGGPLTEDNYEGVYALWQPVKNKKTTLDLKSLDEKDVADSVISGGYLMKFDNLVTDTDRTCIECTGANLFVNAGGGTQWGGGGKKYDSTATCWSDLELIDPLPPNTQQMSYITNYIQKFHDALHAKPVGDWQSYIDLPSFVNNFILNEVTRNVDSWIRSHYMYKDRNDVINCGPVWDYNFAMDNFANDYQGWQVEEGRTGSGDWHSRMWKQPSFKSAVKKRWKELRPGILSNESVLKTVDENKAQIGTVGERNFKAWPMGKCTDGLFMSGGGSKDSTWTGQIDGLKTWLKNRLNNLDTIMDTLPN